jgi:uncharacterized protein YndB with AHSA1/START domain
MLFLYNTGMSHTTTSSITINAPVQKVWDAITNPELIKQWQYGSDVSTDWKAGSPIKFHSEWEGQVYEQWGKVLAVEPHSLIKYTLFAPRPALEDKPENYFTMTYSLKEADGKTQLTITQDDPRDQAATESEDAEKDNAILEGLKQLVEA